MKVHIVNYTCEQCGVTQTTEAGVHSDGLESHSKLLRGRELLLGGVRSGKGRSRERRVVRPAATTLRAYSIKPTPTGIP